MNNFFKGFRGLVLELVLMVFIFGMIFFIKEKYFPKKPSVVPAEEQLKKYFPRDTSSSQRIHHWVNESETYRF